MYIRIGMQGLEDARSTGRKGMNGQLFFQFFRDAAFRDAGKRVLENILTQFEDLSEGDFDKLVNTSVDFLGNNRVREITGISYEKEIESFKYAVGRAEFDKNLLSKVCTKMERKWVISIDESIVDKESFVGDVAYRHSCAFGYQIPQSQAIPEERILAVSSILRLQDDEDFDRKMQFLPYLLNLYVAFYTAKILQHLNQSVYAVILHGPLIRQIAPFLNLLFRAEDVKKVVTADTDPPVRALKDIASGGVLDSIKADKTYQDCLEDFVGLFPRDRVEDIKKRVNNKGEIPGICFYFALLRRLSDLAKEMGFHLIGCVENARSSEYSKLYVQDQIQRFGRDSEGEEILRQLFGTYDVRFNKNLIKERFRDFLGKSGWDDEMIHAFSLRFDDQQSIKSEFTKPVPIRRYFTCGQNEDIFGFRFGSSFVSEDPARERLIAQLIDALYPFDDYRMLMSFVRTSEIKAPIRVEFLEQGSADNWNEVLSSIYIASLPYSSYGLPIFLYYADKMARMPKEVISSVTESYLYDQTALALRQLNLGDTNSKQVLLTVTQKFRRDFFDRG